MDYETKIVIAPSLHAYTQEILELCSDGWEYDFSTIPARNTGYSPSCVMKRAVEPPRKAGRPKKVTEEE